MNFSRNKGRPPKALVTREKIAEAALTIVGEEGYEKLTMARIAGRLGVGPSALYNHLEGKDDLLALIEDAVMAQVDCSALRAALGDVPPTDPSPAPAPAEALAAWARSYRDVFADHVPLVQVIATTHISGAPRTVEMYDLVARVFAAAGVPEEMILPRIIAMESFIYGSAYDVHAPADIFAIPEDSAVRADSFTAARTAFASDAAGTAGPGAGIGIGTGVSGGVNPYAEAPFQLGLKAMLADLA